MLRPELALLLDAARSEVKRWGGAGPNYLHLAAAVAAKRPDVFDLRFGEAARGQLHTLLNEGAECGSEQEVLALLAESDGPDAVATVVDRLHPQLDNELRARESTEARSDPTQTSAGTGVAQDDSKAEPAAPESVIPERSARFVRLLAPGGDQLPREDAIDFILTLIARETVGVPLIVGDIGVGKSTVADLLANRLSNPDYRGPLARRQVALVMTDKVLAADRGTTLGRIFEDIPREIISIIDDVDEMASLGGQGADVGVLLAIRAAVRGGRTLVLTAGSALAGRIEVHDASLWSTLDRFDLPPLEGPALRTVVHQRAQRIGQHHGVTIPTDVIETACLPAGPGENKQHAGLAIARLDSACARASLRDKREVHVDDLRLAGERPKFVLDSVDLADRLRLRVLGQDTAVDQLSQRLSLTTAGLDLRPERPDGVFLFVGPTGVGKTELARAVAAELRGAGESLIRLDMSEYAHDWALSRLIGPQPGYVGFTEPESWLTTRVCASPHSVILLDEIEKAHPTIWNAFLQVFDAGQLSDSRGTVADFADSIIIMTSNLGVSASTGIQLGFGDQKADVTRVDSAVLKAVTTSMPPELVNRLDDVIIFNPLSRDVIRGIAHKEISAIFDNLANRGYRLSIDDDALGLVSASGYDARYGGRHVHRNIEKLLLQPLVTAQLKHARATVTDNEVRWVSQ